MTRRSFFGLLISCGSLLVAGVVGIPALLLGFSPAFQQRRREIWRPLGRLKDFPVAAVHDGVMSRDQKAWPRSFPQQAVFVWRRSDEDLVVFSRSCTDLGCPLDYDAGSTCFLCPCHGGIFNQSGERLAGPPNGSMYRYAHRVREGVLEIDITSIPSGA
jgi:menaquinol-cytochrome c reductase iron-sulfur subunit